MRLDCFCFPAPNSFGFPTRATANAGRKCTQTNCFFHSASRTYFSPSQSHCLDEALIVLAQYWSQPERSFYAIPEGEEKMHLQNKNALNLFTRSLCSFSPSYNTIWCHHGGSTANAGRKFTHINCFFFLPR